MPSSNGSLEPRSDAAQADDSWACQLAYRLATSQTRSEPDPNSATTAPSHPSTGFFAFHGVESRTIKECGWNGGWVKDCFGNAMLDKIGKNTIICSGVSMGSTPEVVEYLRAMTHIMESDEFAKCERNGVDQGVHNVLVHTNQVTITFDLWQQRHPPPSLSLFPPPTHIHASCSLLPADPWA